MRREELLQGFRCGTLMEKKPTVRPGRRWEDNIESGLQEMG
jgi:hypothetical protein